MIPSTCRYCGTPIAFLKDERDGWITIDRDPSPSGNLAIIDGIAVLDRENLFDRLPPGPRYISHAATCIEARKRCRKA